MFVDLWDDIVIPFVLMLLLLLLIVEYGVVVLMINETTLTQSACARTQRRDAAQTTQCAGDATHAQLDQQHNKKRVELDYLWYHTLMSRSSLSCNLLHNHSPSVSPPSPSPPPTLYCHTQHH